MRVRLGLAAWSNKHFDNALYPIGTRHADWLPRYATLWDVAEADVLHHQAAEEGTLQDWVEQTPPGFLFLPKMHKDATHSGGPAGGQASATTKPKGRTARSMAWLHPQLPASAPPAQNPDGVEGAGAVPKPGVEPRTAVEPKPGVAARPAVGNAQIQLDSAIAERFLTSLAPLRAAGKLGPILLQFAPDTDRVGGWDRMLSLLGSAPPGTFAVEVRHTSWFVPAFERILEDFEAPLVWSTFPSAFAPPWRTASYGYLRFTGKHMHKRGRHVTVADRSKEVQEVGRRLKDAGWETCYAIVTNGFEGNAVDSMGKVAAALGAPSWRSA